MAITHNSVVIRLAPKGMSVGVWITGYLLFFFFVAASVCNPLAQYLVSTLYLVVWFVRTLIFVIRMRIAFLKVPRRIWAGSALILVLMIITSSGAYRERSQILIETALSGNTGLAKLMLSIGADARWQNSTGDTALTEATAGGSPEMVQLLLRHGADPNVREDGGITPLLIAVGVGNARIARLLLDAGANPCNRDTSGVDAWSYVARRGDPAMSAVFKDCKPCSTREPQGDHVPSTPLH